MLPSFDLLLQALLAVSVPYAVWVLLRQWSSRRMLNKIPGPRPVSWIKGQVSELFGPNAWDLLAQIQTQYGPTSTISTSLGGKHLTTFDPKAMYHILVKDQQSFEQDSTVLTTDRLVFGLGLLSTSGEQHRKQRKMLQPVFSAAHLRDMTPLFYDVVKRLTGTLEKAVSTGEQEIDILSWSSRTALELIGQSGLGYSFDPLIDETCAHPYPAALKALLPLIGRTTAVQQLLVTPLVKIFPPWFLRFFALHLPIRDLQEMRKLSDTMYELSTEIYQGKLRALEAGDEAVHEQMSRGKDIMSILMNQNMKASDEDKLSEEELIGQMSTLIFAAMDTTSSALARAFHLLSQNLEVQSRLRQELRAAREAQGGEDVPHDVLVALPYLDAICRETLRLYPPSTRVTREQVVLSFTSLTGIDFDSPDYSGPPRMRLYHLAPPSNAPMGLLSTKSRFLPTRRSISISSMPTETLNYGDLMLRNGSLNDGSPPSLQLSPTRRFPASILTCGGRSCIGFKFSQLEMKVVLFRLVETFEFSLSDKDIYWQSNPVANPVVKGGDAAKLPIKIAPAR
ncbi:hypothetical protein PM082_007415 [Marasmius tenuissimus]|nr:hypothetical protein PM082_007415 [Marasmius tenuissimus]